MTAIFPDWLLADAGGLRLVEVKDIEMDMDAIEVELDTPEVTVDLQTPAVTVDIPKEIEVEHDC